MHPRESANSADRERSNPSRDQLAKRAELLLRCRRQRTDFFDAAMFGEPAWDGLLALYVNEHAGITACAVYLAGEAAVPLRVMIRWLNYLEVQGLVIRDHNQLNDRSCFVRLTGKGRCDLERYLSETVHAA